MALEPLIDFGDQVRVEAGFAAALLVARHQPHRMSAKLKSEACAAWLTHRSDGSMIVFFALMPNGKYRHRLRILDLKKGDVARATKADE